MRSASVIIFLVLPSRIRSLGATPYPRPPEVIPIDSKEARDWISIIWGNNALGSNVESDGKVYPMSSILGRYNPSISQGIVSKTSGFGEMAGAFQITAKMNKGNSGGPIFNDKGEIIGISVGKLNKTEVLKKDGFIPEDVNVGISGQILSNFLNMPVKANMNESKRYNASEIYQYMRPSVVFIVSQ